MISKYAPLESHLRDSGREHVPMTFEEIARVIGVPLPSIFDFVEIREHNKVLNDRCRHHLPVFVDGHQFLIFRDVVDDETGAIRWVQKFPPAPALDIVFKICFELRIYRSLVFTRDIPIGRR